MPMNDGVQLKYGQIHGGKLSVRVTSASQTISAKSGKFVYMDDGVATLNVDGTGSIFGFLEAAAGIATTDANKYNCIIDLTAVFRIPIDSGTYVVGMMGDQCDIAISNDIQGAQLDASIENTLTIVGGDAENSEWVDVMMTPTEWGTTVGVDT